jgi:uncharacterized coiled-coil DUF342 family protein
MNQAIRIAPGEEDIEHIEDAIDRAMQELTPEQRDRAMFTKEETAKTEAEAKANTLDLIKRSRASFENNAQNLQQRIDHIKKQILDAALKRDEIIARAHEHHKEYLHQAERELYQITTVKAAIELALAGLAHDPEQ